MYKRFIKWASDRIKDNGIVSFVSNNSFLDTKANDGFRRSAFDEFDYIYVINLKGNARLAGNAWKREGGKIFGQGARVGVTISFFIKTGENNSEIQYAEVDDYRSRENKLKWLADNSLSTLKLKQIVPDVEANWINQTNNDFDDLVPIANEEHSLFRSLSMGSTTARDEWVYDFDRCLLVHKIRYFIDFYNKTLKKYHDEKPDDVGNWVDKKIKWSRDILMQIKRDRKLIFSEKNIKLSLYRPFVVKNQYFSKVITEYVRKFPKIFVTDKPNKIICFSNPKANSLFNVLASNKIVELGCMPDSQCIPLYMYEDAAGSHSNITEFGLSLFQKHYKNKKITAEDIFYYTYAIFNDPKYQEKYEVNLQRKFPRIPLAENFRERARIGQKLYGLHTEFEDAQPYALHRIDKKTRKNGTKLRLKKSDENQSAIIIDEQTILDGVPSQALEYKLGSKCALEWILEFYKESKNAIKEKSCDDPAIRERFNTYRFADHKEHVIDLLQRVTTVSVETVKLRRELEKMPWGKQPKPYPGKSDAGVDKATKKPQTRKSRQPKKPKVANKSRRKSGLQDTLDGSGQKRLFGN